MPLGPAGFLVVLWRALHWPSGYENPVWRLHEILIANCIVEDADAAPPAFRILDARHSFVSVLHARLRLLALRWLRACLLLCLLGAPHGEGHWPHAPTAP